MLKKLKIITTSFVLLFASAGVSAADPEKIKLAEEYFYIPVVKEAYNWAFGSATATHSGVISEMFGQCLGEGGERKISQYMNSLFSFEKYKNFYVESYAKSLSKKDLTILNDFASTETFKNYTKLEIALTEKVMKQFEAHLMENQVEILGQIMQILDDYIKPECKDKFKKQN